MGVVTFLLLLAIAAGAAGVNTLIGGWGPPPTSPGRLFAARFMAYAMLLILPVLLPGLLSG